MSDYSQILVAKAVRVFVFGLVSVVTPVYLALLGYSPLLVGVVLASMVAGNALSNLLVVKYQVRVGTRRFLFVFSLLMLVSGVMLFLTSFLLAIIVAFFIGNISTTGTEAGPFQSFEAAMLPRLVPEENLNRSFGVYNMIGYGASSFGAFAASAPSYFQNNLFVFRSLYLLYGIVGIVLVLLYTRVHAFKASHTEGERMKVTGLSPQAKSDITKLSVLFSIDAFGGGLVSQSLVVYWFYLTFGVSLANLGVIFFVVNIITALSALGATFLAARIGNLQTMVSTHLISNVFLILIPFAGSLVGALAILFARQSVSQMDVPTRQAFMAGIFDDRERVPAYSTTNISRILSNIPGSPITGALLGAGLLSVPLIVAGLSKIFYDGLIYSTYRRRAR